jgi:GT2 family glycosyltransferase
MTQSVCLIIPVRDGGADFAACLAAVARSERPPDDFIVVDDGSGDDSAALAERHGARVLRVEQARGPAAARNLAARSTHCNVLVLIDADVCVHPDTIGKLAAHLEENPTCEAVFGSYDDSPFHPSFISQYKNLLHYFTHQHGNRQASTFWAGCGAIRRDIFLRLGGFDESYARPSVEDIELGYRLRIQGGRIALNPSILAQHRKRWTWWSLLRSDVAARAFPWARLIRRYRELPDDLNISLSQRVSAVLAVLPLLLVMAGGLGGGRWMVVCTGSTACLAGIALLNLRWFAFLRRRRGLCFAGLSLPVYVAGLIYSSLAFAAAMLWPLPHPQQGGTINEQPGPAGSPADVGERRE